MAKRTLLSVVVPVCNEEGNLQPLYERLVTSLETLDLNYEIVFVDDGSDDGSVDMIRDLHRRDPRVRALIFTRNFGHERALSAGIDVSRGEAVVLMDADLQDPPELIPSLVHAWREGFDIVGARRRRREGDSTAKRLGAFVFYRLMRRLAPWSLTEDTGNFCLIDRRVADAFKRCHEWNRFVRVLLSWTGYRQTSVFYDRAPRTTGSTKYGLLRQLGLAATSVTSFSLLPLRLVGFLGMILVGVFSLATVMLGAMLLLGRPVSPFLLTAVSLWLLGGIQLIALGVVGEYVGRTLLESQRRPLYFVRESLGCEPSERVGMLGDDSEEVRREKA